LAAREHGTEAADAGVARKMAARLAVTVRTTAINESRRALVIAFASLFTLELSQNGYHGVRMA
jgi:hypothetical protein